MSCDQEPKVCQSVEALLNLASVAGTKEEWQEFDAGLVNLTLLEPNSTARALLSHAENKNPKIRDGVASGLGVIKISDQKVLEKAFEVMIK